MRRRAFFTVAGATGVVGAASLAGAGSLTGCVSRGGGGPPSTVDGPASPGAVPTGAFTPGLGPSPAPVPAGLRMDGAALLMVFGRLGDGSPEVECVWYDPASAAVVNGPVSMAAWPPQAPGSGFQRTVAAAS